MSQHKYIILDRDGVLNYDSNTFIKNPEEWLVLPRSLEAIALLTKNNYRTLLISNQSGVGRGVITYEDFIGIHNKLISSCSKQGGSIFSTFYCYVIPIIPQTTENQNQVCTSS